MMTEKLFSGCIKKRILRIFLVAQPKFPPERNSFGNFFYFLGGTSRQQIFLQKVRIWKS